MFSAGFHSALLVSATPYLALSACVLLVVLCVFIIMTNRRIDKLTIAGSGSLEETLGALTAHMHDTQKFRSELEAYLKHAESRLRTSVRGVGVVRFNPFAQSGSSGGNQSFAIAFLDEKQSGVVLSALYARDRVGVYAKPVTGGKSTFTLSDEETEAVTQAIASMDAKARAAK